MKEVNWNQIGLRHAMQMRVRFGNALYPTRRFVVEILNCPYMAGPKFMICNPGEDLLNLTQSAMDTRSDKYHRPRHQERTVNRKPCR